MMVDSAFHNNPSNGVDGMQALHLLSVNDDIQDLLMRKPKLPVISAIPPLCLNCRRIINCLQTSVASQSRSLHAALGNVLSGSNCAGQQGFPWPDAWETPFVSCSLAAGIDLIAVNQQLKAHGC